MYFNALLLIFSLAAIVSTVSCGGSSGGSDIAQAPTPTPTAKPKATVKPTPPAIKDTVSLPFLVASASSRFVVNFDEKGAIRYPVFDLKSVMGASGGLQDIIKIDQSSYLAAFDQGLSTKSEAIILLDAKSGSVKNSTWFVDQANFNQVSSVSLVRGFIANTILVATDSKILRVLHDSKFVPSDSAVFVDSNTLPDCPFSSIQKVIMLSKNSTKALLVLSSGVNARLNVVVRSAGAPRCSASLDFTAPGQPTKAGDVPVSAGVMADGKVYVLFQSETASKIVRYSFTGQALTSPELVFADQSLLGAKPRGLAPRSALRFLVGNTEKGRIFEISTAGEFTGFFVDSSFTQDISTIVSF